MWRLVLLVMLPGAALADAVVATRPIPAQSVLEVGDLALVEADIPGALTSIAAAAGQEARVTIYPGRPIRPADLGPPTVVGRNQIVTLQYRAGPLAILAEGRALERGGAGDVIRVLNLGSRRTVTGIIAPDGSVRVGPDPEG